MPHPTRINDLKFASEGKKRCDFFIFVCILHIVLVGRKVFWGYIFIHDKTVVNLWDDTFEYYRNPMVVLSTLKRLTTAL